MSKRLAIVSMCGVMAIAAAVLGTRFPHTLLASSHTEPGPAVGWVLQPKIVWASTRDDPAINPFLAAEIYMMNPDLTGLERITSTDNAANYFAVPSPTGRRIVFDSNRLRDSGPINTSDLFLMNPDGTDQVHLVRGSSATWSPDGHKIAYHASASGTGRPIRQDPGAATIDSDIFVVGVDELLDGNEVPINLTNSPEFIDEDADWSPDGTKIVFVRHGVNDPHVDAFTAEIYTINADGSDLTRLTFNGEDDRGPDWSPDGSRIAYACRRGAPRPSGVLTFEICVMNADGSNPVQLTINGLPELTPTWSLDGLQIVFHRQVGAREQLVRINADGTGDVQITDSVGVNLLASQGVVKVVGQNPYPAANSHWRR